MDAQDALTRRSGLIRGSSLLAGTALLFALGTLDSARAAKADKKDFFYQDKPKDGKSCSACRLFSPADGGKGQCAVVDGEVSPNGWCMAFSPR